MANFTEFSTTRSYSSRTLEFIFYGNFFYGICAVSLIFETAVLFDLHLNGGLIYLLAFCATTLFYNYPYARIDSNPSNNPRTLWHTQNRSGIRIIQILCSVLLIFGIGWIYFVHFQQFIAFNTFEWILILTFPVIGTFYYGSNFFASKYHIRQIAWIKPFSIGFVWAGITNIYPILYSNMIQSIPTDYTVMMVMQFFKTFLFTSILAIMFDIKDYQADSKSQLQTLIVKLGLRKTIFYVIIPITFLGIVTFWTYALAHQFSILKMLLIMTPFVLILLTTRSFGKRRSLLFYLIVIDGLLIVKALFGVMSVWV
ncbi:MAG TPA: hypothetical protein DCE78_04390 [Bacteroidetes bacterium]|nr:hypothetical protein [Bacteroidota bacterium]